MGKVSIPYYVTRQRPGGRKWGYWAPCLKRRSKLNGEIEPTLMAELGFELVDCGEDGPHAWAIAKQWNERWALAREQHRAGEVVNSPGELEPVHRTGSLGEAFARFRESHTWQSKKPRTREDWLRGWKHIEPLFGEVDPRSAAFEHLDGWYAALLELEGVREAHRAMKIWRALWRVVGTMQTATGQKYCDRDQDPSLGIRRKTPAPRNTFWYEGEAVRLVKRAWRMNYRGLAAALAVAWDTMLSPVDVRSLTKAQLKGDGEGSVFALSRAKTGKAAIGTFSKRTARLLEAYVASLPFALHPDMPIFRTRGSATGPKGGRPRPPSAYTSDTLGDDFRAVREAEFPGDKRTLMDFRRSGAVEATAGEVDPAALAAKMANSIDTNRELQATYQPHNSTLVQLADAARARGRSRLRGASGTGTKS